MKQELESLSNIIYVSSIGKLNVEKNVNWVEVAENSGLNG